MDEMTVDDTYVSQIRIQNKSLYIKLTWKQTEDDLFNIQILNGDRSWTGKFTKDQAKKFRDKDNIKESEELYSSNVKKSLLGQDENFTYDFSINDENDGTALFSWKRRLKGINILHGNVILRRDEIPASKNSFIDILLKENKNLKDEIKNINDKSDKLLGELEKCKNELEKYVNIKSSLETTLYGKFVQLLNAKKRRIQLLEDNLLNFEEPNNIMMGGELD